MKNLEEPREERNKKNNSPENGESDSDAEQNKQHRIETVHVPTPKFKTPTNDSYDKVKAPAKVPKYLKRRKIDATEKHLGEACDFLKKMGEKPTEDECSMYCDLLCKKIRGLKENTRELAMLEIDRLIYNLKQQDSRSDSHLQCGHLPALSSFEHSLHPQPSLVCQPATNWQQSPGYQSSQPQNSLSHQPPHSQPSLSYPQSPESSHLFALFNRRVNHRPMRNILLTGDHP